MTMTKSRILIADDAELNRDMLSLMLGEQYDFVYAKNGLEAVDVLGSKETVDLLLLDVNMPEMDGFTVLKIMNERHWIEECPVIMISAETGADFIEKAYELGVVDYISRPFYAAVVQRRVENTLLMYSNQKRLIRLVEEQVREREKINNSMINIFSNIIELRNHESGSHTLNVQTISKLLLTHLVQMTDRYDLSKSQISMISTLSALHDIGKIKVPEEVLNKPGKLTDEEWKLMKAHTVDGDAILSHAELDQNSNFARTARSICRWHHEKYDGKGYPDGLKGDEIPIAAQVVSLADAYDALTSERCYKRAFSHEKAVQMLLNGECGAFNPLLLKCLTDVSDELAELVKSNEHYDAQRDAAYITDELLTSYELPQDNALRRMRDNERRKKDFFMDCLDGIAFEYDTLLHRATFVHMHDGDHTTRSRSFATRESENNIMPIKYWDALRDALIKTTADNPIVKMDVALNIDGRLTPFHTTAMALWPERGTAYISVLGHFTPIVD